MSKIAVVYWSGTGNTKAMAEAVLSGAEKAGEAELFSVEDFSADKIADFAGVAFGCPAMGAEVLEEEVFEPFFTEAETKIKDKPVALFGSYGWGDGEWMRNWEERTKAAGAKLFGEGLTINNEPDDDGKKQCEDFGEKFAKSI